MTIKKLLSLGKETLNFDYATSSTLVPNLMFSSGSTDSAWTYGNTSRLTISSIEQFTNIDGIIFSSLPKLLTTNEYGIEKIDDTTCYILHILDPTSRYHGDSIDGLTYEAWKITLDSPQSSATTSNSSPFGSVLISGNLIQGETLSATNSISDIDGLGIINYQWFRNDVPIQNSINSSYVLSSEDIGKLIGVKASYVDGKGNYESLTSTQSSLVLPRTKGIISLGTETLNFDYKTVSGLIPNLTFSSGSSDATWLSWGGALTSRLTITSIKQFNGIDGITFSGLPKLLSTNEFGIDKIDDNTYYIIRLIDPTSRNHGDNISGLTYEAWLWNLNSPPTGDVLINGERKQGQVLSVDTSFLSDGDGLGVLNFQWVRDGVQINGATQSYYIANSFDVNSKIGVVVSYKDGLGKMESVLSPASIITAPDNSPLTGSVIITGISAQNQTLTASNTLADTDGLGVINYQWLRDDVAITNATQSNYTLTQADVGKSISATAYYTDGLGKLESVSSNTVKIANVNDFPTGSVTITGIVTQNQILTANNTLADIDGLGAIVYQWLSDNKEISNATQSTYKLTQSDVGNVISVKASYTDGFGSKESVTSSSTIKIGNVNDTPTGNVSISGLAAQGQTLTTVNTLADLDGLGTIKYQWLSNGAVISGATKPSYILVASDAGNTISVKASYTDLLGTVESVTSLSTDAVLSTKPSKGNDVLTGTAKNDTLSALAGNDILTGGLGADKLTGGLGADIFKYVSIDDSGTTTKTRDTITDFKHSEGDKIDLSAIDADSILPLDQAFKYIGTNPFSADATAQLRLDSKTGILYGSTNADNTPEFSILLSGVKSLVPEDFIL